MASLFKQIEASAKITNLDDAIRPIQDILGQDDGGLASIFFSDSIDGSRWTEMTEEVRRWTLIRYAVYELGMLEMAR